MVPKKYAGNINQESARSCLQLLPTPQPHPALKLGTSWHSSEEASRFHALFDVMNGILEIGHLVTRHPRGSWPCKLSRASCRAPEAIARAAAVPVPRVPQVLPKRCPSFSTCRNAQKRVPLCPEYHPLARGCLQKRGAVCALRAAQTVAGGCCRSRQMLKG